MRHLLRFSLLAAALGASALAASASTTQTVTLSVGNIKKIAITPAAAGGPSIAFTSDDWTAGQTLSAAKTADGGTLAYSTNTPSKITVKVSAVPTGIQTLAVQLGGGTFVNLGAADADVLTGLARGANPSVGITWQAAANLAGELPSSAVTATFTILDQ